MSVVGKGPRYITPIEQSDLIKAIGYVIDRFNEGATIGTWIALETLYRILPPDVKNDVRDEYERISFQIDKAQSRTKNFDPLTQHANRADALSKIYRIHNGPFFEKIMVSLHLKGYREKIKKPIPSNIASELFLENP